MQRIGGRAPASSECARICKVGKGLARRTQRRSRRRSDRAGPEASVGAALTAPSPFAHQLAGLRSGGAPCLRDGEVSRRQLPPPSAPPPPPSFQHNRRRPIPRHCRRGDLPTPGAGRSPQEGRGGVGGVGRPSQREGGVVGGRGRRATGPAGLRGGGGGQGEAGTPGRGAGMVSYRPLSEGERRGVEWTGVVSGGKHPPRPPTPSKPARGHLAGAGRGRRPRPPTYPFPRRIVRRRCRQTVQPPLPPQAISPSPCGARGAAATHRAEQRWARGGTPELLAGPGGPGRGGQRGATEGFPRPRRPSYFCAPSGMYSTVQFVLRNISQLFKCHHLRLFSVPVCVAWDVLSLP